MTRQLFVHIGPPKTGSTAIQVLLEELALPLLRCGAHCLLRPWGGANRNDLVEGPAGRRAGPSIGARWAGLEAQIRNSPATRFVLSAEAFLGQARKADWPARIAALAAAGDAQARIVAYVRPQWQMLESLYGWRVNMGWSQQPFDEFMTERLAGGLLDYNRMFQPWRDRFGASAVRVTPLEPARLGGDLGAHFLGLLGLGGDIPASPARWSNARPGAKELELSRLAGGALGELLPGQRERRWAFDRRLATIAAYRRWGLRSALRGDKPFAPLTPAQVADLAARFAAANARFARDYGIDAQGRLFLEPAGDRHERPSRATWEALSDAERGRVRLWSQAIGFEVPPGAGSDPGRYRWRVRAAPWAWYAGHGQRLARRAFRSAARHLLLHGLRRTL